MVEEEEEEGMLGMKMRTGFSLVLIWIFQFSRVIANFILFYVYNLMVGGKDITNDNFEMQNVVIYFESNNSWSHNYKIT